MVVCCLCTGVTWGATKWSSPDVLIFGDSGIDGWGAIVAGDLCTFGCPDACVDATGNGAWQDLTAQLRSKGLAWSHMGMNSAPVSELCCVAPLILMKNKPKRFIFTQMGANDLVWYPGMVLKACMDYPMCSFDCFMSSVKKHGAPGLKVIYAPDQVSPRVGIAACAAPFNDFYAKLKDSAGVVVEVEVPAEALGSKEAAAAFIKNPAYTYKTTHNPSAKHPNLIYVDCVPAVDKLIVAKGDKKWVGSFEMTQTMYMHYNAWLVHLVSGVDEASPTVTTTIPIKMERA